MAKTISKNLKLVALLDDQQLKRQIQALKKELGNVDIGGSGGLQNFNKSIKDLNDAANSLKQAVSELKRVSPGSATGRSIGQTQNDRMIRQITAEVTRNNSRRNQQYFDAERGKYVNLGPGDIFDKSMNKRFKSDMHHEAAKEAFKERSQKKEQEKDQRFAEKEAKRLAQMKEMERRKDINAAKDTAAAFLSRTGIGLPMARQVSGAMGSTAPGLMGSIGGFLRGAGTGIGGALRTPLGAGLGIAGAGAAALGYGYLRTQESARMFRQSAARENQEYGLAALQGRGLEGALLQSSRGNLGGLETGLRGFTGFLGAFNPFGDSFSPFSPLQAAKANIRRFQEQEQGAALSETELARGALGISRGLRGSRLSNLRGGGITGAGLTSLQAAGVERGFGLEETNAQFGAARGVLGNRGAASLLSRMQNIFNLTGTGIEEQAGATSVFAGSRRGGTYGAGMMQTVETLKKGVAAGLDVSRAGKFLQTTAEFITSTQGLGNVDASGISTMLAQSARGFAGGGDITDTALKQAQTLQQQLLSESSSTSGIAGIGNLAGLMQAVPGLSMEQLLAGSNISSNATTEDIMEIMGINKDQAAAVQNAKKNAMGIGLDTAGVSGPLRNFLLANETGMTGEQALGRQRAQGFSGGLDLQAASKQIAGSAPYGAEMSSTVVELRNTQSAFVEGMQLMNSETSKVNQNLNEFNRSLKESTNILRNLTGLNTIDNSGQ